MSKNTNSIGQVLVYFTCDKCQQKTRAFSFYVFEGDDGKADFDLLAADVNSHHLLCMNCGNMEFAADIKVNSAVLNYQNLIV